MLGGVGEGLGTWVYACKELGRGVEGGWMRKEGGKEEGLRIDMFEDMRSVPNRVHGQDMSSHE